MFKKNINRYLPALIILINILFITFLVPLNNIAVAEEGTSLREEIFDPARLPTVGYQAGYNVLETKSPTTIIGNIIYSVLGFLGLLFVILIIWSGFQWMTAGGNSDTITKARQRMINATIGLVIILASLGITTFVLLKIAESVGMESI